MAAEFPITLSAGRAIPAPRFHLDGARASLEGKLAHQHKVENEMIALMRVIDRMVAAEQSCDRILTLLAD
jgi:hypothetical protein